MALIILYCCPRRRVRVAWAAAAAIRAKETEEEGRGGADEKAAYPEMGRHKLLHLVEEEV